MQDSNIKELDNGQSIDHVIFINYGLFNSNSGGHIAGFANELVKLGIKITLIGNGDPESLSDFGISEINTFTYKCIEDDIPDNLLTILRSPRSIIHAWTPRECVHQLTKKLVEKSGCRYVVHLEDNEEIITSSQTGLSWAHLETFSDIELDKLIPKHLSIPRSYQQFLRNSCAVTIITDSLKSFVPCGVQYHVLEPGVDTNIYRQDLTTEHRNELRQELYIKPSTRVIVYHGNMHSANKREVFSLYTAVLILKRRGFDVILIRAGKDFCDGFDVSMEYLTKKSVINLGYLSRDDLIRTLKISDVFVQPGSVDEFNIFRLPSKIPEFLSLGRPVIVPRTNIGLKLKDGEEAIMLDRGDGVEIADKIQLIIQDEELELRLGNGARKYAKNKLSWSCNASSLVKFYNTTN